ncbi:MAG: division/cell wall cluster transcriptional repressor MraZ [Thermoleophilaceae bacterium]
MAFRGHFEHSLDAKHRLSIPARYRTAFGSGLVLSKDSDACITVSTPEAHEQKVERAVIGLNPLGPEYKRIQRYFQGNSFDLDLDSAGRVTLPVKLLAHAGVDKEVVVAGVGEHLEVWSREGWQAEQEALDAGIEEVTNSLGDAS